MRKSDDSGGLYHVKITNALAAAAAVAAAGSMGIIGAPIASAEDATTTSIGSQAKLVDGNVVQGWTISNLKTSSDAVPYPVQGTLWEATATDEAIQGGATPIVSNLNARARSGQTYRALFGVATSEGVNPSTLGQGQKTTGKVYFDVTGDTPDSVVYNAGGQDLLVWVKSAAPASTSQGGGTQWRPAQTGGGTTAAPAAAPGTPGAPAAAGTPGTPGAAPAGSTPSATEGTPLPAATEGIPGAPLPAGSQGTPLPAGSQGTPLPAGSQGTPLPAGTQGAPAAAGTQGAPQPAAVQGAPAPEDGQSAPVPAGSQGTPAAPTTAAAPTTTVAPAPPR
jgi:hypothetical protein